MKPGYEGDPKDNQSVFSFVLNFLREQGGPAFDDQKDECRYRMGGKCCAAGCLIPDEDYNCAMEGEGIEPDLGVNGLAYKYFEKRGFDMRLLCSLQSAHDQIAPTKWELFERGMKEVATNHELAYA